MFNLAISPVDLAIVIAYMMFTVLLGIWVSGRQENVNDYFLGDRSLPWWALLISIVATETSTVTFLSIPGVSFAQDGGDFRFLQVAIGYIVGRTLVSTILLPAYFRGNLFTSYEVLQQRFGETSRRVASLLFMVTRTLADALRLYLTAIVLREVIQLNLTPCVLIIGIATIGYTFFGGMRSVVWNDCIQFVVYMLGATFALIVLTRALPAGWDSLVEFGVAQNKFRIFDFSVDPRLTTYTVWIGLIGGAFLTLATHGTDQLTVQRLLSARQQREARWALIGSGFVVAVQFALFLLIGVGLACFYQSGDEIRQFTSNDQVFASFIVEQLPLGVVGMTLAAVFSAAMSTLSSSLNASANALVSDFIRPLWGPQAADRKILAASRAATVAFGIAQIAIAVVAERIIGDRSAVYKVLNIAGFTTGPILGLFFLAALRVRIPEAAALTGFVAGITTLTCIAFLAPESWRLNGFYYSFVGSLTTLLVGLGGSRLFPTPPAE